MEVLENQSTQETGNLNLNKLTGLYHGTGLDYSTTILLQDIGLLGERTRTTLTSNVVRTMEYAGHKYQYPVFSVWYPGMDEVSGSAEYFNIESRISDSDKDKALKMIGSLDLAPNIRLKFNEKVKRSDKLLPSSRLASVIAIPQVREPIINFNQQMEHEGLVIYSRDPKPLFETLREVVEGATYYLRPDLSVDILVDDMVRIGIETQLRLAGEALMNVSFPKVTEKSLLVLWERKKLNIRRNWASRWAPKLTGISFEDHDYENYRQALLKMYENGAPFL